MIPHRLYSIREVAREIGLDRGTVSNLVRLGKIRCLPISKGRPKIPGFEVLGYMKANLCSGSAEIKKALDGRRR